MGALPRRMIGALAVIGAVLAALLATGPALAEVRLMMLDRPGCIHCLRWDREVGEVYPLTPEGRAAPLLRAPLKALPEGVTLARPAAYTPTFILLRDGQELARIEGYPGEAFFWGLLGRMLRDHGVEAEIGAGEDIPEI